MPPATRYAALICFGFFATAAHAQHLASEEPPPPNIPTPNVVPTPSLPLRVGDGPDGFTPIILGPDAWQIWIAPPPLGSDDNPGTRERPKATAQSVLSRLDRPTHGVMWFLDGTHDIAIRAQHEGLSYGGLSREKPLTFAADPATKSRPIIVVPDEESAGLRIPDVSHVRVQGLEFRGSEQQASLVAVGGNATDILIEDCHLKAGTSGITLQGQGGRVGTVIVRRTIIQDQRNLHSHGQGIFVSGTDVAIIEDNVLWNTGNRDTFCQGMYLVHDARSLRIVRRNFIGEPGFAGVQARGGTYEVSHNVFDRCGNGFGVGHPMGLGIDTEGDFFENVILNPKPPAWGIAIQNMHKTTVRDNLLFAPDGLGYMLLRENPSTSGEVRDNRGYGWSTWLYDTNTKPTGEQLVDNGNARMSAVTIPKVPWTSLRARGRAIWTSDHDAKVFVDAVRAHDPWK